LRTGKQEPKSRSTSHNSSPEGRKKPVYLKQKTKATIPALKEEEKRKRREGEKSTFQKKKEKKKRALTTMELTRRNDQTNWNLIGAKPDQQSAQKACAEGKKIRDNEIVIS